MLETKAFFIIVLATSAIALKCHFCYYGKELNESDETNSAPETLCNGNGDYGNETDCGEDIKFCYKESAVLYGVTSQPVVKRSCPPSDLLNQNSPRPVINELKAGCFSGEKVNFTYGPEKSICLPQIVITAKCHRYMTERWCCSQTAVIGAICNWTIHANDVVITVCLCDQEKCNSAVVSYLSPLAFILLLVSQIM